MQSAGMRDVVGSPQSSMRCMSISKIVQTLSRFLTLGIAPSFQVTMRDSFLLERRYDAPSYFGRALAPEIPLSAFHAAPKLTDLRNHPHTPSNHVEHEERL